MTVRAVAEQAGVSPKTVYKAFGGKEGLMKALWDVTLAGDDQPVAIADRPQMQEEGSAADPAQKLTIRSPSRTFDKCRRYGPPLTQRRSCAGGPGSSAAPTSGWRRCTACSPRPVPRSPRCSPR